MTVSKASTQNLTALSYGGIAILAWSVCAYLVCVAARVPLLQLLALSQILGALIALLYEGKLTQFRGFASRARCSLPFALLMMANQLCYAYAFRAAPPAQVDLINYTWPTLIVLGEALRHRRMPSMAQFSGLALCLIALGFLLAPGLKGGRVGAQFFSGYITAAAAGISWALYSLYRRSGTSQPSLGTDLLLSGVMGLALHVGLETWHPLSMREGLAVLLMGACVWGLAVPCWNRALQIGGCGSIGGLANAIPILSVAWLVIGGVSELTIQLIIASVLVTMGCYVLHRQSPKPKPSKRPKGTPSAAYAS